MGCSKASLRELQHEADSISIALLPDSRLGVRNINLVSMDAKSLVIQGETSLAGLRDSLFSYFGRKGYLVIDSLVLLPDGDVSATPMALSSVSIANLRKYPSHSSELVSQAILGTPMQVLKKEEGWLLVKTPDNYHAWVTSASVQLVTSAQFTQWQNSQRVIMLGNEGWVYAEKGKQQPVCDWVAGSILEYRGSDGKYTEVALPDGRWGFVDSGECTNYLAWKESIQAQPGQLVETAFRYMGIPYLWGGMSAKALDCSGFVRGVYFLNGIILHRDASQQFRNGQVVEFTPDFSKLEPGDLLFFGDHKPLKVTHVGMYCGAGRVIHASVRVRVNSMDERDTVNYSSYLKSTFLGARRVLHQPAQEGVVLLREHPWY